MRKLLFVIGMLVCIHAYPQDSLKRDTGALTAREVYNDAKVGIKEAIGGIKDMASKLEGPAKHVYSIYVRQHLVEGISFGFVCIFLWIFGVIVVRKTFASAEFSDNGPNVYAILLIVGLLFVLFAIVSTWGFFGGDGFSKILNPEYFAIQDIIQTFK